MEVYFRMCGTTEVHPFEVDHERAGELYEKDGNHIGRELAFFTREAARNHVHEHCVSCQATGSPIKRVMQEKSIRMASDIAEQASALARLLANPDNF